MACGAAGRRPLRLLLDAHFSPEIAHRLRDLGHDVVTVSERPELMARPDRVHFASAPEQRRAIVTQDLGDFRPLLAQAMSAGSKTYGLVCVSARVRLRRGALGPLSSALDALLEADPDDDAAMALGGEVWLTDLER